MSKLDEWIDKYTPPYIKRLTRKDVPCEGIKYGTVALRDLYSMGDNPPRGIQERSKCKNRAKYNFKALKRVGVWESPAASGNYCNIHLIMQLERPAEERRASRLEQRRGME